MRNILQIVLLDVQAAGDVILDRVQPLPLVGRERDTRRQLLSHPLLIPVLDRDADGGQDCARVDRVPNQGDHVHQLLAAPATYLVRFDQFISLPQPVQRFGLA